MTLSQIRAHYTKPKSDDLFIFDIDSTLLTTHQRNQAIVNDFLKQYRAEFPQMCQKLTHLECRLGDYGYYSALKRIGFENDQTEDPCLKMLQQFWGERFFSNDYLNHDTPTDGAVEYVQKLFSLKIPLLYLTARHHKTMWPGTLSSMQALGFPIDESILFLKEDLSQSDEEYKSALIKKILPKYQDHNTFLIDNEPVVLNRVLRDHPNIQLIWFDSTHSGRETPPPEALRIQDFIF